jgi:hypothetical protein
LGIPAMIAYILFLIVPLKRLGEVRRDKLSAGKRGEKYYLAVGLETSIIAFMVSSFFLSVAYLWYAYYLVGYAIALSRLADNPNEAQSSTTIRQPQVVGALQSS